MRGLRKPIFSQKTALTSTPLKRGWGATNMNDDDVQGGMALVAYLVLAVTLFLAALILGGLMWLLR